MTSTAVPPVLPPLLRALETSDLEAAHTAFTPDVAIHDEGEVVHGPAGVDRWATRNFSYAPAFRIDDVVDHGNETVVTTTVTGEFPGSPLVFHWHLTLAQGKVASLRIDLA